MSVLAIDAGTTGVTALLVTPDGTVAACGYTEFRQHYPQPGWVEHFPEDIWQATLAACRQVMDGPSAPRSSGATAAAGPPTCIGITNQRETVCVWDRASGRPLHRAIVWQDREKPSYWRRYRRAIRMLCLTIVPWLLSGILTVFGREWRAFLALFCGGGLMMGIVWAVVYDGAALATAFLALIVRYHLARPHRRWRDQVPGALIATILWWLLTAGFSLYVRNMHYNLIYGSMAAVIGLIIWMYFVAGVRVAGGA